jgi:uncharacterized membrane protein
MAVVGIVFALLAIFLLIGAVLGWIAVLRVGRLESAVERLERQLRSLDLRAEASLSRPTRAFYETPTPAESPAAPLSPAGTAPESSTTTREPAPAPQQPALPTAARQPGFLGLLFDSMRRNWMAWLGGISVSLAGVFLVGYGIEMGYLGPRARILVAILAGLALHAGAEYFRRRTKLAHPAFAAMAGGGSITLYAALFAALELHNLLSPGLTFTLLAVVSIVTMALATVHGPLLATLGILGAYIVPILVSEHAGGALVELVYSLIVTSAALLLIRFVHRPWLWYGTLAGALGWWLISLGQADADGFRGYYLAAFAYLALAIPTLDWLLKSERPEADPGEDAIPIGRWFSVRAIQLTVLLIAIAEAISIVNLGFTGLGSALALWCPLTAIVLWARRTRESLRFAPWLLLLTQLGAWLVTALDETRDVIVLVGIDAPLEREFFAFAVVTALLFSVGLGLARLGRAFSHLDASLIWLSPVLWLALSYLLVAELAADWRWSAAAILLGLAYVARSGLRLKRHANDGVAIWLLIGGHAAYSLAAAMFFREATLTLALAAQLVSLAWLGRRFELPALGWLLKGVLAIVVARLTLNPWLLSYAPDTHWSLWTYGGSALCCFAGARLTAPELGLRKWLEAATLHLVVLFLGAEVRYRLYDGAIFVRDFTLTEAAINTSLWAGLGLSYFFRARHAAHLARLYTICSRILLVLSLASYGLTLTFLNPLWSNEPVASTPLMNIVLLAYGAPVALATIACFGYDARFRSLAAIIAGLGLFVFVTLEIRHLWQGALDLDLGAENGEIYTYSAVWLVMAIVTMLGATRLGSRDGYRAGTGLLLGVIAKIFLYDMEGLEGLLRVASFMGLGLALLGLAWLYQRTTRNVQAGPAGAPEPGP